MRIANLPTAISNVVAGAVLARYLYSYNTTRITDWLTVITPVSCLLYVGGMILNDAFDAESDAIDQPSRPIPSGAISRRRAFHVGFGCLLAAILLSFIATFKAPFGGLQPFVLALVLSVVIVTYNGPLKRTWLSPLLMGACRTLNILLGASYCMIAFTSSQSKFINYPLLTYAFLIGLFVIGITLLAKGEHKEKQIDRRLAVAGGIITISLVGIGLLPWLPNLNSHGLTSTLRTSQVYGIMVILVSFPVLRRILQAIRQPSPSATGTAIVTSLSRLIFLDAAVCFLVRPDQPIYAGAVALLIIPVMILRRFSAQT